VHGDASAPFGATYSGATVAAADGREAASAHATMRRSRRIRGIVRLVI
jgi:hypothetical protein